MNVQLVTTFQLNIVQFDNEVVPSCQVLQRVLYGTDSVLMVILLNKSHYEG